MEVSFSVLLPAHFYSQKQPDLPPLPSNIYPDKLLSLLTNISYQVFSPTEHPNPQNVHSDPHFSSEKWKSFIIKDDGEIWFAWRKRRYSSDGDDVDNFNDQQLVKTESEIEILSLIFIRTILPASLRKIIASQGLSQCRKTIPKPFDRLLIPPPSSLASLSPSGSTTAQLVDNPTTPPPTTTTTTSAITPPNLPLKLRSKHIWISCTHLTHQRSGIFSKLFQYCLKNYDDDQNQNENWAKSNLVEFLTLRTVPSRFPGMVKWLEGREWPKPIRYEFDLDDDSHGGDKDKARAGDKNNGEEEKDGNRDRDKYPAVEETGQRISKKGNRKWVRVEEEDEDGKVTYVMEL